MGDLRDDIERYCKGELSPAEMHALERKALTDPFLADALEGANSVTPGEFEEDMAMLQQSLERRRKPSITLWVWAARIAAGVALIALATFMFLNAPADQPIAEAEKDTASPNQQLADSAEVSKNIASAEETLPPEPRSRKRSQIKQQPDELPPEATIAMPESPITEEDLILPESEKKAAPPTKIIQGFVVDAEDGQPLPGVNVTLKGSDVGTITDEEGNYEIAIDSLSEGLVFSYVGFESKEVVPGGKDEVSVALEPDITGLSEIVVVGYGAREPAEEPTTVEMAEPSGGKKAFKQYLEQNLRYPEQALNNKVEGKVTVQFTIQSSGVVSDFRVVKGLGYGCDEEVIRLIQEGPKWQPTKRNHQPVTDKVKVRLKFSLPKKK
jgi:TonB family protein